MIPAKPSRQSILEMLLRLSPQRPALSYRQHVRRCPRHGGGGGGGGVVAGDGGGVLAYDLVPAALLLEDDKEELA